MNKVTSALLTTAATLAISTASFSSQAAMDPYVEKALIQVCKAAQSNNPFQLTRTTKEYHLKTKVVALNVMCNDMNIINFAEKYGAERTANKLIKSLGQTKITDIAETSKLKVSF